MIYYDHATAMGNQQVGFYDNLVITRRTSNDDLINLFSGPYETYIEKVREETIDGATLFTLRPTDVDQFLKDLGCTKVLHVAKIKSILERVIPSLNVGAPQSQPHPDPEPEPEHHPGSKEDAEARALECPFTLEIMEDPVQAADGQTYDRRNIEDHFTRSIISPITREELTTTELSIDWNMRRRIEVYHQRKAAAAAEAAAATAPAATAPAEAAEAADKAAAAAALPKRSRGPSNTTIASEKPKAAVPPARPPTEPNAQPGAAPRPRPAPREAPPPAPTAVPLVPSPPPGELPLFSLPVLFSSTSHLLPSPLPSPLSSLLSPRVAPSSPNPLCLAGPPSRAPSCAWTRPSGSSRPRPCPLCRC